MGQLVGEVEAEEAIAQGTREESERVIASQQRKENEVQEAAGEDGKNGGDYKDNDKVLQGAINDIQVDAMLASSERSGDDSDNAAR